MVNCLIDHPTNHVAMVEPFAATAAWMWWISPTHPWEPLWKKLAKGGLQGFCKFNDAAEKKIISINSGLILVLLFNWSLSPPKRWHYVPQAITPGRTSSPVSPPPCLSISGWLLCVFSSIGGHFRPQRDSFYIIFCCPNHHPNNGTTSYHTLQPLPASLQHPS